MIVNVILLLEMGQLLGLVRFESLSILLPSPSDLFHFISSSLVIFNHLSFLLPKLDKSLIWSLRGSWLRFWLLLFRFSKELSINFLDFSINNVNLVCIHPERSLLQTKLSSIFVLSDHIKSSLLDFFHFIISFRIGLSGIAVLPSVVIIFHPGSIDSLLLLLNLKSNFKWVSFIRRVMISILFSHPSRRLFLVH
jgi:hypothetical protein